MSIITHRCCVPWPSITTLQLPEDPLPSTHNRIDIRVSQISSTAGVYGRDANRQANGAHSVIFFTQCDAF
jgi:hypothetical protein